MSIRFFSSIILSGAAAVALAQNPIIQTKFTPDPAPYVHGDTVYLFVDHDEDHAQYFRMKDWMLYSSTDMVNWTFRGVPMSTATFKWAKQGDNAWAAQAVERNGKWYWYVSCEDSAKDIHGIGVAVANAPDGPYKDALGKPLVPGDWGFIDPSVFIDDDGRAYLFWGNNGLWYGELNDDMVSLKNGFQKVTSLEDESAFGPKVMKMDYQLHKKVMKTGYEEGPWVSKRNGLYYLVYAAGGVPEHMAYSTSTSINGPWTYRGRIMGEAENSFTIHGGSIEIAGRNFMFYHNGLLPNGGGFRRSTAVEEFSYNPDGTIPYMKFTKEGVTKPLKNLDPYKRVEAETMAYSFGLKTDRSAGKKHYVTSIHNGDWLKVRSVDFKNKLIQNFNASTRIASKNHKDKMSIEIRIDRLDGDVIGELEVKHNFTDSWNTSSVRLKETKGVHDLYFIFRGGDEELFEFDWWKVQ